MKKIVSLILTFCMVACMGITTLAAGASDRGSVTVKGLEAGVTVSAYQIAYATYDSSTGQFLGYAMNASAGGFSIASDGSWDESALTEENLAALYAALSGAAATASAEANADGTAVITDLPVGAYLLVVTGSEGTVYGMMIGSVYYSTEGIVNGSFDIEDCEVWAKATTPSITKEEVGGSIDDDDWSHGGSADLGDTLTYHITVDGIPAYQGANPEFYVTDEISTELTITDTELAAMKITVGSVTLEENTDYTVARTSNGFIVNFVVDGAYTLNQYAGQSLVIEFQADVTEAAAENADDHENDVTLTYATTSYVTGQEHTDDDADHDYTFAMKAQKTGAESTPLAGATFTLYTDDACTSEYKQNSEVVSATSDNDGYFSFSGLQEGTYYMKETVAPDGYTINTIVYKVVIAAEYGDDGAITNWTITITDDENNAVGSASNTSATNAVIPNTQVSALPSTGGMGTIIFTALGCMLMLAAAAVVIYSRRRTQRNA